MVTVLCMRTRRGRPLTCRYCGEPMKEGDRYVKVVQGYKVARSLYAHKKCDDAARV